MKNITFSYPHLSMHTTITYIPPIQQSLAAKFGILNSTFRITATHPIIPQPIMNYES